MPGLENFDWQKTSFIRIVLQLSIIIDFTEYSNLISTQQNVLNLKSKPEYSDKWMNQFGLKEQLLKKFLNL